MLIQSLLSAIALAATVAWDPTGTWVAGRRTLVPLVAAARDGGAFVAWVDRRAISTRWDDVYAQHLNPNGLPSSGWQSGGMPAATTSKVDYLEAIAAAEGGGVFIAWNWDQRAEGTGLDEMLIRLDGTGQQDPRWPAAGRSLARRPWDEDGAQLCSDGADGVFAAWMDYRRGGTVFDAPYCRAVRVLANGATAPGWPDSGLAIADGDGVRGLRKLVSDGLGGAYVVWNDTRVPDWLAVYVLRFGADGQIAAGWPVDGRLACSVPAQQLLVDAIPDGEHGIILAWDDDRSRPSGAEYSLGYLDIYAARLRPDGTHPVGWPKEGLSICLQSGMQAYPRLCPDGSGGAVIVWEDARAGGGEMYVQRMLGTGQVASGWPINGRLVSTGVGGAEHPRPASDMAGGAYIVWANYSTYWSYATHFRGDGSLAPGWTMESLPLADVFSGSQQRPQICSDAQGHAIVVWQDVRPNASGGADATVRAQKLVDDGPVPTQLALRDVVATSEKVRLTWWGQHESATRLVVERGEDGAAWADLGTAVEAGAESVAFTDLNVEPGHRYAYRLTTTDRRVLVAAQWVDVPSATRFALAGAIPNPARAHELTVSFSLSARGAGTLELLDLSGRRAAWRDLGPLAPGSHSIRMPEASTLAPGVYWLRLAQGVNTATTRVVLIR